MQGLVITFGCLPCCKDAHYSTTHHHNFPALHTYLPCCSTWKAFGAEQSLRRRNVQNKVETTSYFGFIYEPFLLKVTIVRPFEVIKSFTFMFVKST